MKNLIQIIIVLSSFSVSCSNSTLQSISSPGKDEDLSKTPGNESPDFELTYEKLPPINRNRIENVFPADVFGLGLNAGNDNIAVSPDGRRIFTIHVDGYWFAQNPIPSVQIFSAPFKPVEKKDGKLSWFDDLKSSRVLVTGRQGSNLNRFFSNSFSVGQSKYPVVEKTADKIITTAEYKILGHTKNIIDCSSLWDPINIRCNYQRDSNGNFIQLPINKMTSGFVTVKSVETCNLNGSNCTWKDTFIEDALVPLTFNNNGVEELFYLSETSITADGRLMVFSGPLHSNGSFNNHVAAGFILYTYNNTPYASSGWSKPRMISNLYTDKNVYLGGLKLSERFPIAEKPLTDAEGRLVVNVMGNYPWISPEGTEIIHTASGDNFLDCKSGLIPRGVPIIVGKLTGSKYRMFDGLLNSSKSGDPYLINGNECLGHRSAKRFLTSVGLVPNSIWQVPFTKNNVNSFPFMAPLASIPKTMKYPVYPVFDAEWGNYSEISMHDYNPDNILYFHMSELLKYTAGSSFSIFSETVGGVDGVFALDLTKTPDTSGNTNNGYLKNGAAFEYTLSREDRNKGFIGQGVQLPENGYVEVPYNITFDGAQQTFTAEAMVRLLPNIVQAKNADFQLLTLENGWGLKVTKDKRLGFTFLTDDKVVILPETEVRVPLLEWFHVAVVKDHKKLFIYLNGEEVFKTESDDLYKMQNKVKGRFFVGFINNTIANNTSPVAIIDEVSWNKTSMTPEEVAFLAGRPIRAKYSQAFEGEFAKAFSQKDLKLLPSNKMSKEKIELGKKLFFDESLSADKKISCASCHDPERNFTDGKKIAVGVFGRSGSRNSPTVLNRVFGEFFMLDGSKRTLEAQVTDPFLNPVEMGMNEEDLLKAVSQNYQKDFSTLYKGNKLTLSMIGEVLATFVNAQTSKDAPFDTNSLNETALNGKEIFFGKARCASCHTGPNFTDESFHNTVVRTENLTVDLGRQKITKRDADMGAFKTPTLRGVGKTAPYFHDGSKENLREVIEFYNRGGRDAVGQTANARSRAFDMIPLNLSPLEIQHLENFLNSL